MTPGITMLGGLFDRPLHPELLQSTDAVTQLQPKARRIGDLVIRPLELSPPDYGGGGPDPTGGGGGPDPGNPILPADCPDGFYADSYGYCHPNAGPITVCGSGFEMDLLGNCVPIVGGVIIGAIGGITGGKTTTESTGAVAGSVVVNVNNAVDITDTGIQQVADQITKAIDEATQQAGQIATNAAKTVAQAVGGLVNNIGRGIAAAFNNIGSIISQIATFIWNNIKDVFVTIGNGIVDLVNKVKDFLTPILTSLGSVLDAITKQVQYINDTLITPIANIYNTTIKTITTLTIAIEQDLHDGLSGILKIPADIAGGLASLDATVNRTIQQLGTLNKENVTSGITFAGTTLPKPFGDAMAAALGGSILKDKLSTTFGTAVTLSGESLQNVSKEAIAGLGTLLNEILHIVFSTFKGSIDQLHGDWSSIESVFVGLLDGALGLLTTLTAMGALASPLIDAAEQEARTLVPTRKLDPQTAIEALKRGFLDSKAALSEIATSGLDATRQQVLIDLSVFLADVGTALDWWYRGIITDDDLAANMKANGVTKDDSTALVAASVYLPTLSEFIRWLNFGIITQDEFVKNVKALRYDDAQIQTILSTYQERIEPDLLMKLQGLLNNSSAGFIQGALNIPVPADVTLAGERAGYHPDTVKYLWDGHWELPSVHEFIHLYFRGLRTLTEVQQRMAIANIPKELWDDMIQVERLVIPHRSVPNYVKLGVMTVEKATKELQAQGFSVEDTQIILASVKAKATATTAAATSTVHTLSLSNARTLWADGALTDLQYQTILESHGFTPDVALVQMKADKISEHIKSQKLQLADLNAEVQAGIVTLDDAISQLRKAGFSDAQVAKFQLAITKALKVNSKHPSMAELKAFMKAGIISLTDFGNELAAQGWQDPWLSAFVELETPPDMTTVPA